MAEYTNEEYLGMLLLYGEMGQNARAAAREYARRFPTRRHPNYNVILRLINRANMEGTFQPQRQHQGQNANRINICEERRILQCFRRDPGTSIRRTSIITGVPRMKIWRALKSNRYHPYHYTKVQHLHPGDQEQRLEFCQWILRMHAQNPQFIFNIIWTDEAIFTRGGFFNTHNYHFWAEENPHAIRPTRFQYQFSRNLWAGLFNNSLVSIEN